MPNATVVCGHVARNTAIITVTDASDGLDNAAAFFLKLADSL
jgi:hypothetical protein